jgi:hypothetical protein
MGPGVRAEQDDALIAEGWARCFIAQGARLEEAVQTYEEIGFEVTTVPVQVAGPCSACFAGEPAFVIYTRPRRS